MEKIAFNTNWSCWQKGKENQAFEVFLPHDAMQLDSKKENSPSGVNNGWYDVQDYSYAKTFYVPKEDKNMDLILEFEGIYHRATVYVNGQKAAYNSYGYLSFYVNLTDIIEYGAENRIQVDVINSDQPNSRWYSGTGIYRPVWLYKMPKEHVLLDGIKISTVDYKTREIEISVRTNSRSDLKIEILDKNDKCLEQTVLLAEKAEKTDNEFLYFLNLRLADTHLWSPESPVLYRCRVTCKDDCQEVKFGIRTIDVNTTKGFCINDQKVILRGCCIHHDNGLLGARGYEFAERRKIKILQENGYNAVRSAHNPCSKAILDYCDETGMLVMDEYVDVWYIHKTKFDYASEVEQNYPVDLQKMVDKDYNHSSVIMYSTGNEVCESAQKKGIELCRKLTQYLHKLDDSRPVTCGINIFFNFLSSVGFGVYSDKKADQAMKDAGKKKAVGSEFFNQMAGILGADFMKFGASLYPCDVKTKDAFANMDVAGYNYGIKRYKKDLKKYPERIILGSETFCSDAYKFWEFAKSNPRLIGDFVWSGMDYLGEVAVGAHEYPEYAENMNGKLGWVSAGSGRIDLTGKALSEMSYTRVAFELDKIGIGVVPVNAYQQKHSPSAWKMTNAIESWSFDNCDGIPATVEVYSRAHHVAVFLNGRKCAENQLDKDCRTIFQIPYEKGELLAVAYDSEGKEEARKILRSASETTKLMLEPEMQKVNVKTDLCYIRMKYTDELGILKPQIRGDIKVKVSGGKLLALGSACPFYKRSYLSDAADTYYGEAMAIVQPGKAGTIKVTAKSPFGTECVEIEAMEYE